MSDGAEPTYGDQVFREVFEASTNPMLLAGDDRRYIDANEAACTLLGLSRDEVLRLRVEDLAPPESRPFVVEMWRSFLEEGHQAGHFDLLLPDGSRVQTDYSSTANIEPGCHLSILLPVEPGAPPSHGSQAAAPGTPLTARELQVLGLLALGHTREEIAEQLGISPETVRNHLRGAREKLGARTRAQAIALALSRGLIKL
jgi:PAS domain S-box-containing protein